MATAGGPGCGRPASAPRDERAGIVELPASPPPRARPERSYALTWGGAALGWARERDDGRRWIRHEQVVVRRGDAIVASELELTITRDDTGAAATVELARWQDGPVLRGRATAIAGGWRIEVDGEPLVIAPAATPFELAIAAPPPTGFRGPVLLAGYGFAVADLALVPDPASGAGAWLATLTIGDRPLTASILYDVDGGVREIRGADGVVARAAPAWTLAPPTAPIEVVGGSALPVEGLAGGVTTGGVVVAVVPAAIWLPGARGPRPPALPGQRVAADVDRGGWIVRFEPDAATELPPGPPGPDRTREIADLARQVADEIEDDLGATALTEGDARVARRGDCTTHALRFAARAADAGLDTRVVTGLRFDAGALVRHRWVVAWTGRRWLAVDPTYAETPAAPVLLGLAVHGPRAADLALADAVVFDQLGSRALAVP